MQMLRFRFWLECALAGLATALTALTLIEREWIEVVFGIDPDRGSGALEWGIVLVGVGIAVTSAMAARIERRRVVPRLG